jgi:hypothetical protein
MISRASASQNFIKNNRASVKRLAAKLISDSDSSDNDNDDSKIRKSIAYKRSSQKFVGSSNLNQRNDYDVEEAEYDDSIQYSCWKKIYIKYGDTIKLLFKLSWVVLFYLGTSLIIYLYIKII